MRIISLAPSNTEILYALGAGDEIVAVTHLCDYPQAAKEKEKIGTWIYTEAERLRQYNPDFIFTSYFQPESLKHWRGPGKIVHVEPRTLKGVYESIETIGDAIEKRKEAQKLIEKMKNEFKEIQAAQKEKKKVYMEEWHTPPMVSGNWVPELVEIAGGIEGLIDKGESSREFYIGELKKFNPDVIICHWCGFGKRSDVERVKKRNIWEKLRAVKEDKIFFIDDSLINRPGPRLTEGARTLQQILAIL